MSRSFLCTRFSENFDALSLLESGVGNLKLRPLRSSDQPAIARGSDLDSFRTQTRKRGRSQTARRHHVTELREGSGSGDAGTYFLLRRTVHTESLRPSPCTAFFECNLLSGIVVSLLQIGLDLNSIFYVVSLLVFVAYGLYAPRIQVWFALNEIGRGLTRLKVMKDRARKETIDYLTSTGKAPSDPTERVDQFLDYITIMPVDIDPNGIVGKIDHVVTTRDERVRQEVGTIVGDK